MRALVLASLVWLVPIAAMGQAADGAGPDLASPTPVPTEERSAEVGAIEGDGAEGGASGGDPAEGDRAEPVEDRAATATEPALAPKITLVVVGDPDPILVAAALEIEARLTLGAEVRVPADASLRAALRGDAGAADDGLEEVRRERRRLGLGEASDAPILARLGRRAGAVLVIAVRESESGGPEALALDVRSGQFFEGALPLLHPEPDAVARFVSRRARSAARGAATAPAEVATGDGPSLVPPGATTVDEPAQGQDAGQWFEQNWPYFAAGALLAAAIAFVVVTATDGGSPPPMLRFQPGTP